MKLRKLFQLSSALILSLSTLLTLSIPLVHAATSGCQWLGGQGNDDYTVSANWSCTGTTPGNGDIYNLTFPASAADYTPIDNISGLSIGSVTFSGNFNGAAGYLVTTSASGITATIGGGITDTSTNVPGGNIIDGNLTLAGNQEFSAVSTSQLYVGNYGGDTLNVGSNTLTLSNVQVGAALSGNGTVQIQDSIYPNDSQGVDFGVSSPSFSGSVLVQQGALFVDDPNALTNASSSVSVSSGALLSGVGGMNESTIESGGKLMPGHTPGCITANSVIVNGTYVAEIGGTTACASYDQLQVSNTLNLTGATLQLSLINNFTPKIGQSFEILNNSGNAPVTGTFTGLAEGATFTSGGYTYHISYIGGDGNDVILTVVSPVVATATGNSQTTKIPTSPDTGLAIFIGSPWESLAISTVTTFALLGIAKVMRRETR